jgi:hypothetical protein
MSGFWEANQDISHLFLEGQMLITVFPDTLHYTLPVKIHLVLSFHDVLTCEVYSFL